MRPTWSRRKGGCHVPDCRAGRGTARLPSVIYPKNLTSRLLLDIVSGFRVNREPVAVQVAREWSVCRADLGRLRYTGNSSFSAGSTPGKQARASTLRRSILAIVPATPSSRLVPNLGRGPRMGYAGRNSETEPTPTSSSSGERGLILGASQGTLGHRRLLFV